MQVLGSFVEGRWIQGSGKRAVLVNPATEEPIAETSTEGIDMKAALAFARTKGGAALRALTFAERGELLVAMSRAIHAERDKLLDLAMKNGGNTRSDAKFDVDGASGTLAYYGGLGKELGSAKVLADLDSVQLGKSPRFVSQHLLVPRRGVAVHVNAFNFPAWGLGEKAACAILAGMPVVVKPATSTALVAHRIVELFVEQKLLPEGALSLVAGAAGDLLDHLEGEDVLSFTGGGTTAATLRAAAPVVRDSIRVNVEADSLNAAILGADVEPGSDTYEAFIRDVVRDITQKTGQKCTAIRRVFAPRAQLARVVEDLVSRLEETVVGDPCADKVTMGPVATAAQHRDVKAGIEALAAESKRVLGEKPVSPVGVPAGKGYFIAPTLFVAEDGGKRVHEHEVFGPSATVIPFDGSDQAVSLVRRGGGGLVTSLYTDDRAIAADIALGIASAHGRVVIANAKVTPHIPGPGTVLPQSIHGGPGRAGGGEELGGLRGLAFYSQRVALQGDRPMIEALVGKPATA
ncbi:MAG TPA: 3,4-dehydroadipyl-CoA semialdehyde dehydrogenase [Polyangiaceae bacterium]|nr:3,4-dehydroadipyl-CoA semialdehyde dehydrogenase [Polyangiaceae bacterium]